MEPYFDRAIPGQSLTTQPGSSPWENPPRFTDLNEALSFMWDKLTSKDAAVGVVLMLKKGVPAEYIANTILMTGFTQSLWNVDIAGLMRTTVIRQIVAIGKLKGVSNIVTANPKTGRQKFLEGFIDVLDSSKKEKETVTSSQKIFSGIFGGGI